LHIQIFFPFSFFRSLSQMSPAENWDGYETAIRNET